MIQEMPADTREEMLESIRQTIVHFMAPIPAKASEPLEEPEPHDQEVVTVVRYPQPYSTIGGTREDFRPKVILSISMIQNHKDDEIQIKTNFKKQIRTLYPKSS